MGSGVRKGIPGEEAKTRDVTAGFKDFYYHGPHSSIAFQHPLVHNPHLCPAISMHTFVDKWH